MHGLGGGWSLSQHSLGERQTRKYYFHEFNFNNKTAADITGTTTNNITDNMDIIYDYLRGSGQTEDITKNKNPTYLFDVNVFPCWQFILRVNPT